MERSVFNGRQWVITTYEENKKIWGSGSKGEGEGERESERERE